MNGWGLKVIRLDVFGYAQCLLCYRSGQEKETANTGQERDRQHNSLLESHCFVGSEDWLQAMWLTDRVFFFFFYLFITDCWLPVFEFSLSLIAVPVFFISFTAAFACFNSSFLTSPASTGSVARRLEGTLVSSEKKNTLQRFTLLRYLC